MLITTSPAVFIKVLCTSSLHLSTISSRFYYNKNML